MSSSFYNLNNGGTPPTPSDSVSANPGDQSGSSFFQVDNPTPDAMETASETLAAAELAAADAAASAAAAAASAAEAEAIVGLTPSDLLLKANNLSDVPSPSTARNNLGLATVASSGSAADLTGTLPQASDPALTGDVTKAAGNSTTTIANGAVSATKLASGAALSNLGYTPANKAGDTFTGAVNTSKGIEIGYDAATGYQSILVRHNVGVGAGYFVQSDWGSKFVALSGWDSGANYELYFGGGGWGAKAVNRHYFYVAPTYGSGTEILALYIVNGYLNIPANWAITWGSGYGIRDNGGAIEVQDSGGSWLPILRGTVSTAEIADLAVTTGKIANNAVDNTKLATGAAVANLGYTPANKAGDTLTGSLTLVAGSSTVAPATFQSGSLKTTPAAGDLEWDGVVPYATSEASNRAVLNTEHFVALTSTRTLTNNTSAQAIFAGGGGPTNGAITLAAGTYFIDMLVYVTGLSGSGHTVSFGLGGTATVGSLLAACTSQTDPTTLSIINSNEILLTSTAATVVTASGTFTPMSLRVRGVIRITSAGTLIPQLTQNSNSAAAVVQTNSYCRINKVGAQAAASIGNWS